MIKVNFLTEGLWWFHVFPRTVGTGKLPGRAGGGIHRDLLWPKSMFCAVRGDNWDGGLVAITSDNIREDNPYRTHHLHQSWDIVDSIATLTEESVFEPLSVGDKSLKIV